MPRNPAGYRIGQADFDLTVTSPDGQSVVGQPVDAAHWSVCACKDAPAGTTGTITAAYPAQALDRRSRVPGVAIVVTTTFETAAAKGTTNPPGCAGSTPAPLKPAPPVTRTSSGAPAPTGFRLLPSLPIIASLGWDAMPNAAGYTLRRAGTGTPTIERAAAGTDARDTIPDPRITYHYTLIVRYADGASAESPVVDFVSPPLVNPAGFTATHKGQGVVAFAWSPVPGAARYRLDGPGLPGTGYFTKDTSTTYPKIPSGMNVWKLTALYQGNYADYPGASTASAAMRLLPPHSQPWLSKNNGPGSAAIFQAPKDGRSRCEESAPVGRLDDVFDPDRLRFLGDYACHGEGIGLESFVGMRLALWAEQPSFDVEAVYGNAIDLGVGRRAQCAQTMAPAPFGITTTCYATAHGVVPGEPGFNDPTTITHPGAGSARTSSWRW